MMSQVGHNVHNVTPTCRLLIMVEKAQFIDVVRLLRNLGIMWDVHYHSHLGEYIYVFHTVGLCDCFYNCLASHIDIEQSANIVHNEASHLLVNCTFFTNKRTV